MIISKTSNQGDGMDRQARILMGKQVFCLFLILMLVMLPFIVTDLFYSLTSNCKQATASHISLGIPLSLFLLVKASTDILYVGFILITSLVILSTDKYKCFLKFYGYYLFFLAVGRFGWMILGSIMFWGSIFKRGICSTGENAYIWIDLIIGFVTIVLNFLTTKSPAT